MKNILDLNNPEQYHAILFDLDGTLYSQKKLKRYIAYELIKFYLLHPWQIAELRIISVFREEREKHAGEEIDNLSEVQFQWVSDQLNISSERIKATITKWMNEVPLGYLKRCRYPWVGDIFELVKQKNIPIIIYSDYPASKKMSALDLQADQMFSAEDSEINALKPSDKGINWICEKNNLTASQCLFVGDRDDRDGECARKAGMAYYILTAEDKK